MIGISNSKAEEMKIVLGELRRMALGIPGNRASNMRRRASLLIYYLKRKQNGKKKTNTKRGSY